MYEAKQSDQVTVRLSVEYYRQKKKMSCWYAAAKMVWAYRFPNGDFEAELEKTAGGREMKALYEEGLDINSDERSQEGNLEDWSVLTRAIGMQEVDPLPRDARELGFMLRTKGPLWCAGFFFQGSQSPTGHIVVAVGGLKRKMFGSMKDYVIINDPAPLKFNGGMEQVKMYDAWFAKKLYDPHITNGESPMMYLPPKEQLARIRRI